MMRPTLCRRCAALALLALAGCAGLPRPMTREELSAHPGAPALVAYLSQPDASPEACRAAPGGAPLPEAGELGPPLLDALLSGAAAPEVFEPCAGALLRQLPPGQGAELLERLSVAAAGLAADPALEQRAELQARLAALHRTIVDRAPGLALPPATLERAVAPALARLASAGLGPVALAALSDLREAAELDRGTWRGETVNAGLLDRLANPASADLLRRCALRLPDPALREAAARRLLQLRIAASPYPELRAAPGDAEEAVLRRGANPVALVERPVRRAWLDAGALPQRTVLVRQELPGQTAKLHGLAEGRPEPSVLPDVALHGALRVEVAGISRAITVCVEGALDPSPCVAADEIGVGSPLAGLAPDGAVQVVGRVGAPAVVALARAGATLRLPLTVGGRTVEGGVSWPVRFARPESLILEGRRQGGDGPPLALRVERVGRDRLVYTVASPERTVEAVVEWADAGAFRVVSRGAAGHSGADGRDGADGLDGASGSSASCPSSPGQDGAPGGDGQDGQAGGDGGPGGRGGDVRVLVSGPAPLLEETLALLRTTIASEGGAGGSAGSGGRGGRGGSGGSGGSGTTCFDQQGATTHLASGRSGQRGADGRSGSSGWSGAQGAAGLLLFERQRGQEGGAP